ncbi:Asp-tRNA(Asn)/Glu-tRNA(Gln) amidotransferase subunit GatA [Candidatus Nucleicultrix amoebiphila]|uniref:Glutamyl-tRNA(Gln) amidotransferase subunit A n=1 Tax=Candidatus Nucleicultrix amoebiphila FS5 TaxID=1414854 RepID=A0A1W6N658_9PROT|nr:Asp-tRNA(Asn)/Glu-tRNA(Gln) amidotransferase subunit GatA [Candidatus Nucleicultrix amoebiphila]ARN85357.1 glutamyl-tRNA amidotransferase [Candidatus Nucleicultrix amoebiphila FS5]
MDLTKLTLSEALAGLKAKKFSATELTQSHIKRIEASKHLNAFITETPDLALSSAENSDNRIARGEMLPLDGIPLAIKDLFCTQGIKTTAGSHILGNFVPHYESTVTSNLWKAGGIMLGKTSMDEFAMGSSNLTSAFGPVINPWHVEGNDKKYVPGGSSGGSCAAIAGDLALGATATDTGGSIRQPASFCGIVGIKPTYGRCSRWGIVAFASSLDQAGPVTKTVEDAALMLEVMAGHDPKDATSVNRPVPHYSKSIGQSIQGLKVGIPKEYRVDGMNKEVAALWDKGIEWLKESGAEIVDVSLPHTKYALPTYYIIAPAEASSNLARYDGIRFGHRSSSAQSLDDLYELTRSEGFGNEVKRRILIGTYALSAGYYEAYYIKAQKVRRLITQDFEEAFKKVDVMLTPTVPSAAFAIGEEPKDPISMYMMDVLTVTLNLAGLPGISIPAGINNEGLPLGLQLISPAFEEERLFKVGAVIEKAADFSKQIEKLRKAS